MKGTVTVESILESTKKVSKKKNIGIIILIIAMIPVIVCGGILTYFHFDLHGDALLDRAGRNAASGNADAATIDYLRYVIESKPDEGFKFRPAIVFFTKHEKYLFAEYAIKKAAKSEVTPADIKPTYFERDSINACTEARENSGTIYVGQCADILIKFPPGGAYPVTLSVKGGNATVSDIHGTISWDYVVTITGLKAGTETLIGKTPTGSEFTWDFEVVDFEQEFINIIKQDRNSNGFDLIKIDDERLNKTAAWYNNEWIKCFDSSVSIDSIDSEELREKAANFYRCFYLNDVDIVELYLLRENLLQEKAGSFNFKADTIDCYLLYDQYMDFGYTTPQSVFDRIGSLSPEEVIGVSVKFQRGFQGDNIFISIVWATEAE